MTNPFRTPTLRLATASLLCLSATELASCASWHPKQAQMQHTEQMGQTEQNATPTQADCMAMKQQMMADIHGGDKGATSPEMMAMHQACMDTMPDMMPDMMKDCPKMESGMCTMMKSDDGSMMPQTGE
ncbi:hypothetical protein [Hyphomonas sp.]|uniref:hypothetical protein n=1 Tax=Hyphomonas sp. TaxID=87 RepID=UPI003568EB82